MNDIGGILVTGGAGFVGATLVRRLVASGYRVRVLDNLSTGDAAHLCGVDASLVKGDIRDADALDEAVAGCDAIIQQRGHAVQLVRIVQIRQQQVGPLFARRQVVAGKAVGGCGISHRVALLSSHVHHRHVRSTAVASISTSASRSTRQLTPITDMVGKCLPMTRR